VTVAASWPELETLSIEVLDGGVAVLRTNRPNRMNAQTVQTFREYGVAARALRDSGLRALVLTGAGERAFCAGFDLAEIDVLTSLGTLEFLAFQETATNGIQAIRHLPFPVIAAVHGPATGGGLSLALAADIRLVAPTAMFSTAFVKVGLSFGELGVSYHLSRLVGYAKAAEIGYSARLVKADEAVTIGLANRVVPADDLLDEALGLARTIADQPPAAVRLAKSTIQRSGEVSSYGAAMELEVRSAALLALDR
jgi:enoyl-CoA hydratase/carnithine racemase